MSIELLAFLWALGTITLIGASADLSRRLRETSKELRDAQTRLRAEESLHAAEVDRLKQSMRQALSEIDTFIATWRELYKTEFK